MEATSRRRCSVIAAGHVVGVVGGRVEGGRECIMLQFGASIHRINDD